MKLFLATFLVCGTIVACAEIGLGEDREERADPIIAGQRNSECMGRNNETGSCQSRRVCSRNKGVASGLCGFASGVCCTRTLKPNDSSQLKRTFMRRPIDRSSTDFTYKILPMNNRICQLRIDFRILDLAQPVLKPQMDGTGSTSECSEDYLLVNGIRLCGFSVNQHLYQTLDERTKMVTIQIHLSSTLTNANWDIQATQLECGVTTGANLNVLAADDDDNEEETVDSVRTRSTVIKDAPLVAPRGCLQYYPNATGTVSTFNFDSPNVDMRQYLPNLNYAICFNRPNNEVMSLQFESFEMSDRSTATAEGSMATDTVDSLCDAMGVQVEPVILQDFLMIPRATYNKMPRTVATFFCGKVLDQVTIDKYSAVGPFVINFNSDNFVDQTKNVEKGFRFTYRLSAAV